MRFGDFSEYGWATYRRAKRKEIVTKKKDGVSNTVNASVANGLLLTWRYLTYKQNLKGQTHVFEEKHFNSVNIDNVKLFLYRK